MSAAEQPHGVPSAGELVTGVREFLEEEILPSAHGSTRFHALVATNVLAQIERELATGDAVDRAHAERLATLGAPDDAALVQAIRSGALDDRVADVVAALRPTAVDRLAIGNPRHLGEGDRPDG